MTGPGGAEAVLTLPDEKIGAVERFVDRHVFRPRGPRGEGGGTIRASGEP